MTHVAPYGSWSSPISAADVASDSSRRGWLGWVDGELWWTESRPGEGGRITLMRQAPGPAAGLAVEVLPAPWNVRSRIIEYGGHPWAAASAAGAVGHAAGVVGHAAGAAARAAGVVGHAAGAAARAAGAVELIVVFTNWSDQRLYRFELSELGGAGELSGPGGPGELSGPGESSRPGSAPRPISPVPELPSGMRFAELFINPARDEVWCVRETHVGPSPTDVRRDIVAIPLDGSAADDPGRIRVLAASHHFLSCPRLSPDGARLSWIGWDHPSMPWDETTLCVAPVSGGETGPVQVVAGGGGGQAIVQVEWTGPRTLVYVSDPDGWWNLFRLDLDSGEAATGLCPREEEFGGALWQLGGRWIAPLTGGSIAAIHGRATTRLSVLGSDGTLREIGAPYTEWAPVLVAHGTQVAGVAGSTQQAPGVLVADSAGSTRQEPGVLVADTSGHPPRLASAAHEDAVDTCYLPEPEARTFVGADGRDIHANVYPPRNPGFTGPAGRPAPYVVWVHGGPTSRAAIVYDLEIAYFTSRGIGVVEVNYGGSTGHGRAYRERLVRNWGLVDAADCAEVALALAAEGTADAGRLAIRGGSAGGWTSACSIASGERVYRCGVISYPILDLAGWRTGETHDFESRYLESLVGPWPAAKAVYHDRSPVNNADRIEVPFLLLQGLEDVICPPLQCERLLDRMGGRGIPHAYLTFPGEQHGFRKAETIVTALEAELSFLGQILGFDPPGIPRLTLVT
ncbi:MAG TPA: prolyl oligopeptidase family serine peptidase [Streptosporangiaceae bacterium]